MDRTGQDTNFLGGKGVQRKVQAHVCTHQVLKRCFYMEYIQMQHMTIL